MPNTSVSPSMPLVPYSCYPAAGAQREWVWAGEAIVGSLRGTAWGSRSFSTDSSCFCSQLWGLIVLALESWTRGLLWIELPTPQISLPSFYPRGCEASQFQVHTLATSLYGCGFFNSIVVRLPFSSISNDPEWWLFYILVVILMWLFEEESHLCLCCHLD